MVYTREGYAPWSLTRKAGVQSATVDGDISVPQYIQPVLDTGFVDDKGDWKGSKSSDDQFKGFQTDLATPNNATVVVFSLDDNTINMNGYDLLQLAIQSSATGNLAVEACSGPDTLPFQNLQPVIPNDALKIVDATGTGVESAVNATVAITTADAWMVISIAQQRLTGFGPMSFKVTNQSGSEADLQFAYRRIVLA